MVCAKKDYEDKLRWSVGTPSKIAAMGLGPFSGEMNTILIIAKVGYASFVSYGAFICSKLNITEGGKTYGDWYLPSRSELILMYDNKAIIDSTATANGGSAFISDNYWSSNQEQNLDDNAYQLHFGTGILTDVDKSNYTYIRAVRAF